MDVLQASMFAKHVIKAKMTDEEVERGKAVEAEVDQMLGSV